MQQARLIHAPAYGFGDQRPELLRLLLLKLRRSGRHAVRIDDDAFLPVDLNVAFLFEQRVRFVDGMQVDADIRGKARTDGRSSPGCRLPLAMPSII